ncbi:periplasmic solute-binding protein [Candidatus Moduliflexus flocculans]|uniref:Periplasmic solute-binding protein n=1 Tax=Candidatus Moduliflexus flocculans TaxID=1499966 RepID=A0A081BSJ4_9BACT|nr:periplasmic solute-binding protein [Candidatus Moduliflexus flocculans]
MKRLVLLLLLIVGISLNVAAEPLRVMVSIQPQVYFVKQLGGDLVNVTCLLPAGAFHGMYEPTAAQMKDLSQAALYIRSMLEHELAWWDKIQALNLRMIVVDATQGVELIEGHEHHHGEADADAHHDGKEEHGKDLHIWLSPRNAKIQTENIYQGLIAADPANRDAYTANRDAFLQKIDALDQEIQSKLATLKTRTFMVFHPAWGYFARDYELEQIPIEVEGKEPSAAEMAQFIKLAQDEQVKVIFVQPQTSSRTAEIIAKQVRAKVELLDPMAEDWLENLRKTADALANALN